MDAINKQLDELEAQKKSLLVGIATNVPEPGAAIPGLDAGGGVTSPATEWSLSPVPDPMEEVAKIDKQIAALEEKYLATESLYQAQNTTSDAEIAKTNVQRQQDTTSTVLFQQNLLYEQVLRDNSVYLLNQLGPFHLLIMGTNETGTFSKMMIKNVRVIDENQMQGVAQPNIVNRITFGAEDIIPMTSINANSNQDSSAIKDMAKWGGSNMSLFSGSDVMRDIEYMAKNDGSQFINTWRNY
jgi:hypothetical protein